MQDESRVWTDPRDRKSWRIERTLSPPNPYREAGSPIAARLAMETIRFLHPAAPGTATEWVTAKRRVFGRIADLSEQQLELLLDEARAPGEI